MRSWSVNTPTRWEVWAGDINRLPESGRDHTQRSPGQWQPRGPSDLSAQEPCVPLPSLTRGGCPSTPPAPVPSLHLSRALTAAETNARARLGAQVLSQKARIYIAGGTYLHNGDNRASFPDCEHPTTRRQCLDAPVSSKSSSLLLKTEPGGCRSKKPPPGTGAGTWPAAPAPTDASLSARAWQRRLECSERRLKSYRHTEGQMT